MGNTESNVTSGVKKQAAGASVQPVYKLCDLKGKNQDLKDHVYVSCGKCVSVKVSKNFR